MASFFDYLDWRGDLTFEQSEFNEIDALILSWVSYVALDGIVPAECSVYRSVTVQEASERFFQTHDLEEIMKSVSFTKSSVQLLKKMAETRRFQEVRLTGFVNRIEYQTETQFCAMTAIVEKNKNVVIFRGTDDTLIGWKEDFNMSFLPTVPAQQKALSYFEAVADCLRGKFYITGHSKGGNLAVYAGVRASFRHRHRILKIYNNDGPGFYDVAGLGSAYEEMLPKIHSFIPEFAVVGMLLEQKGMHTIVKSTNKGFFQHDAMSWEIYGKEFVTVEKLLPASVLFNDTIRKWLLGVSDDERASFVDTVYKVFASVDIKTVGELVVERNKILGAILKEAKGMNRETRSMIGKTIGLLVKESNNTIITTITANTPLKNRTEKQKSLPGE